MDTIIVKLSATDTKAAMKAAHALVQRIRSQYATHADAFRAALVRAYAVIRAAKLKASMRLSHAVQIPACRVSPGQRIAFGTGAHRAVVLVRDVWQNGSVVAISWSHKGKDVVQRFAPYDLVCKVA